MTGIDEIKKYISDDITHFESFFRESIRSKVSLLDLITKYVLKSKGKQLRPLLVFLSARLFAPANNSTYIAATLIELLHTATLIHDDVIDNSNKRRGLFSINAIWKSKIAVLVGDYFLSRGLLIAMKHKEYELLEIVTEAVKEMSEGELKQIQKSRKLNITESEYYDIIKSKTATLFAACCSCGAKSVHAGDNEVNQMYKFGESLGIAFQIKDDLLDYTKFSITGKPVANDIKEKKLTLPLIYSLNQVSKVEKKRIIWLIENNSKSNKHTEKIIDFVKHNGGIEYATKKMEEYRNTALNSLTNLSNKSMYNPIIQLTKYITERKK